MKRIAVLSVHSCPLAALGGKETGGMNVYVRELSRQMGRQGWRIDVFTRSQNPHISRIVSLGRNARVIHIKAGPEEPVPKNDLLQFMPEFAEGVGQFAGEEKIAYDLVHSHYWLSGWVGSRLKESWSVPWVHMYHTLGVLKNFANRRRVEKESEKRIMVEAQVAKTVDGIIAASPWEREQMISRIWLPPSKVKVIPCGVDLRLFKPVPSGKAKKFLGLSDREFVLFVGRIDVIKGIDVLIRAIHELSRKKKTNSGLGLIIIGGELDADPRMESREMQRLRALVNRMNLKERVAFWGSQRQDLLPYFYSAADALVLPSRYESFGMVALEAMACGAPVIATRVGGLQFTVEDHRTGLLVPEGDWHQLADRIQEVIADSPSKKKMISAALARVKDFSWPIIAQKILAFYNSLIQTGRKKSKKEG